MISLERVSPICLNCMSLFDNICKALSAQVGWYHASKARLLPLGDVCGVIAQILSDLVEPADVYLAIYQSHFFLLRQQ